MVIAARPWQAYLWSNASLEGYHEFLEQEHDSGARDLMSNGLA